jgi:hypothetical protein
MQGEKRGRGRRAGAVEPLPDSYGHVEIGEDGLYRLRD